MSLHPVSFAWAWASPGKEAGRGVPGRRGAQRTQQAARHPQGKPRAGDTHWTARCVAGCLPGVCDEHGPWCGVGALLCVLFGIGEKRRVCGVPPMVCVPMCVLWPRCNLPLVLGQSGTLMPLEHCVRCERAKPPPPHWLHFGVCRGRGWRRGVGPIGPLPSCVLCTSVHR
jgi:hypothetical protein